MAKNESLKVYNTFVRGLVTEATPLTYPENAVIDGTNCVIDRKGDIRRRLGIDYEASFALTSLSTAESVWQSGAVGGHVWEEVGGDGDLHFGVVQVGPTLYFYDLGVSPLSSGRKSFTVDLNVFRAPAATDVGSEPVDVDFGKGLLFVVSKKLKPFYIEYDSSGDSITNTEIGILIRDFDGVDDSLDIDEEPTTLSNEHSYNLKNQGWVSPGGSVADPVTTYFTSQSKYPGNNKQWWTAKDSSTNFDPVELTKIFFGNTLAPRGHYILDPFNKDRTTVSGVAGLTVENEDLRPQAVAFFAGRAWYGLKGDLYFSQLIEDNTKIGRCYQEADPTSEEFADLVDTDGGHIVIPEAGTIRRLFVVGSSLLVFASNGVWEITGSSGSGFAPTDYAISHVASVGIIGARSLTDVEGTPVWWSSKGIYTIGRNEVTDRIEARSMTDETIQDFYDDDINKVSKAYATGVYDETTKRITFLYNSTGNDQTYRFKYDKALVFDTKLGSFFPSWTFGTLASNSPYIFGALTLPSIVEVSESQTVIRDSDGETVIRASDAQTVVASVEIARGGSTSVLYLAAEPTGTVSEWTFAQLNDQDFFDWTSADGTGISFDSNFETVYLLENNVTNRRQTPKIWIYSKRTETGYTDNGGGSYTVDNPSSCYLQGRWQFADHSNSGKFSKEQQVYRLFGPMDYDDTPNLDFDSGYPVTITRVKVRGSGQALTLRFRSESGKDFDIYGWAVRFSDNAVG